jgi:DnaJ-like protein
MGVVIFGVVVLALVLLAVRGYASASPRNLAIAVRVIGASILLTVGATLAARGLIVFAIPFGIAALAVAGWLPFVPAGIFARTQKSPGQVSRVRSAFIEMELEHDSGAMRGRILAGPHEGTELDALDVKTLTGLLTGIDDESRALLMAYLDRRAPGWRDDVQADAAAGEPGSSWTSGKMTEEEAYQILGLHPGASAEEIGRAHRSLMKKLHPDQGGSTYLAARVNQAKDVLLRRHR